MLSRLSRVKGSDSEAVDESELVTTDRCVVVGYLRSAVGGLC
jgi:hypothetical protein